MSKLKSAAEIATAKADEPRPLKVFILEDDGTRGRFFMDTLLTHSLTMCNNAQEAVMILSMIKFDMIFLDHDLGGRAYVSSSEPNTGMYVAERLRITPNVNTPVVIHSWNILAAKNMLAMLQRNKQKQVAQAIFGSEEFINMYTQTFNITTEI